MVAKEKKGLSLTTQILLASVLALVFGAIVGDWTKHIEFIGTIWLRLIQMSIIILVMTSVAGAIGNIEGSGAGKMTAHTFKYIIIFTIFSSLLGLGLGILMKPGQGIDLGLVQQTDAVELASTSIVDTIVDFVPTNIFGAMSSGNTVQAIVFSLIFGVAAGTYARRTGHEGVLELIRDTNGVVMEIINMVMKLAPIGIFALLAPVAGVTGFDVILPMMKFLLALLIADIVMFLVYFPLAAMRLGINPMKMPAKFAKMSIMALTTTSGAITLPTKMEDSVTKFGVDPEVNAFTGPITMSMNSSGAVACYVIAILFMAQATGTVLTPVEIGMGILLAIMMVMGTIVVPGGSVVVYTFFASSLGLPPEGIAILISIDWFAGALRTLMNVDIDVLVGMLVSHDMGRFHKDVYNGERIVEYGEL